MEAILTALVVLACPPMMGACMWMMARSHSGGRVEPMRVETLSIAELRAEQRRLAAEIERLEMRQAAQAESDPEADERVPEKGGVAGR